MKETFIDENPYDDNEEESDDEGNSNIEINLNFCDLVVGDFVLVNYEEERFPGNVLKIYDEGATITCMQISGQPWKWPKVVVEHVDTPDD